MSSRDAFETWLAERIDTSSWGKDATKTVDDLWAEVSSGECVLEERGGHVLRSVIGVGATLWQPAQPGRTALFLQETLQQFESGVRYRDLEMSLGEKCHAGEPADAALIRGFKEELDLDVVLSLGRPLEQRTILPSDSYPGTLREYRTSIWNLLLPPDAVRDEYCEVQATKTNLWHWRRLPYGMDPPPMNGTVSVAHSSADTNGEARQ